MKNIMKVVGAIILIIGFLSTIVYFWIQVYETHIISVYYKFYHDGFTLNV